MSCLARNELALLGLLDGGPMPFPEPGTRPSYAPSWTVRPRAARLRLVIDPEARTWEGSIAFELDPLVTYEGSVRLDCEGPEVLAVVDGEGHALSWRHVEGGILVRTELARTLAVRFRGSNPSAGLYFTGPVPDAPTRAPMAWTQCQDEDAHFIFPCFDHPRVKHAWTIELHGPIGSTLLSNGRLLQSGEREGRAFTVWSQEEPMPAYLFTAVVGPLVVMEDVWRDRSVRYLVPPGEEEPIARSFGRTPEMMEVFSAFTGVDYPWSRYDQVVVHEFVFGGMENTACTTMTDALLVDARTGPHWDPEGLVCHELAHQWFGDLVTCQDWSQGWLNESFATFMETVWAEHRHGPHEAAWYAFGQQSAYLDEDSGRYRRPIVSYLFKAPIDVFDRHLYEKGAVVLRTLRHMLGDAPFRAAVKAYVERHAHGVVHTRDLQRAFEDVTGRNLDGFFAQWIHGAGHPSLRVDLGEEPGLVTVAVSQGQTGPDTPEVYDFELVIEVVGEAGVQRVVLPVRERERTFVVPYAGVVHTVRVDPGFRMLADLGLTGPLAWLVTLAREADPVLAVRALRALAKRGGAQAEAAIDAALTGHPFWGVRADAAGMVGARRSVEARTTLLAALGRDADPRVDVAVIKALGSFREAVVADALLAALGGTPATWYVQAELLEALGRTRDVRAIPAILPHLQVVVPGDVVRNRALLALALTEQREALDHLLAFSRVTTADRALFGCAKALGVLGDLVIALRPACGERLAELALAGTFRARYGAVQALGALRDPSAEPVLQRLHASDADGRIRRTAWESLWRVRQGRAGDDALKGLRDRLDGTEAQLRELRGRFDRHEGAP